MRVYSPERKKLTPLPPKVASDGKPPVVYAKLRVWGWSYFVKHDGIETFLFRKFSMWPSRQSRRKAVHLADRLDRFMELSFDRGFASGMHPDDKLTEPRVHTDDGSVYHVEMYPFAIRRMTIYHWVIAYAGWVADLKVGMPSGITLTPRGKPNLLEHRKPKR